MAELVRIQFDGSENGRTVGGKINKTMDEVDARALASDVETPVPAGAVFTDTVYDDSGVLKTDDTVTPVAFDNKIITQADVTGGGDMLKSVYDPLNTGSVANALLITGYTVGVNVPGTANFTNYDTAYTHSQVTHADPDTVLNNVTDTVSEVTGINKLVTQDDIADFGGGDMLRLTYDTDESGVVDNSQLVNGFSVGINVPANALFTDTTYSVEDGGLTEFNLSTALKTNYDAAYTHSQAAHAPVGAEVNTVEIDAVNVFTAAQRGNRSTITYAAAVTPDFSLSNRFDLTLNGNVTINDPSNLVANQGGIIYVVQSGLGAYTITWGSKFIFLNSDDSTGVVGDVQVYAYEVYSTSKIAMTYIGVL